MFIELFISFIAACAQCNNVTVIPIDDCCRGLGINQAFDTSYVSDSPNFYMEIDNVDDAEECCKRCYNETLCVNFAYELTPKSCFLYGDSERGCIPAFLRPVSEIDRAYGIIGNEKDDRKDFEYFKKLAVMNDTSGILTYSWCLLSGVIKVIM
ncbi:26836_t:CDS:2, partial [Dentiscutata erythropus]